MENKKTKILAIGDIHGDTGLVKRLAERAKKESVDIIILAGDLTMAEQSIENIVGPLVSTKKQVLLIPGNHESAATIDFLSKMYGAKNLHGYGMRIGDLGIFGAGTANMGPHSIGESGIAKLLKKAHGEVKDAKRKVMVTHIHHAGSKSEMFGFKGSKAVRKALEEFQPDVHISSHIHEAGSMEEKFGKTLVINVSKKEKIFEI
ncbi:MAG: metallophosphoesterase [Candidatus Pacearchaeota archaeon]|nr:metallophosphoesterase [Candidatus Pacearchaeota archaeon]